MFFVLAAVLALLSFADGHNLRAEEGRAAGWPRRRDGNKGYFNRDPDDPLYNLSGSNADGSWDRDTAEALPEARRRRRRDAAATSKAATSKAATINQTATRRSRRRRSSDDQGGDDQGGDDRGGDEEHWNISTCCCTRDLMAPASSSIRFVYRHGCV